MLSVYLNIKKDSDQYIALVDPLSDDFWQLLNHISYKNTKIYRDVFKCYPDDIFTTFEDFKYSHFDSCIKCLSLMREKYFKLSEMIQGYIVEFPLNYLKKENLDRGFSKEKVMSVDLFL
jgi:phospholipase D1/2